MEINERIYTYPQRFARLIEVLSAIPVVLALLNVARVVLGLLVSTGPGRLSLGDQKPWLRNLLLLIGARVGTTSLAALLLPLLYLLVALLLIQFLRNLLPTVRVSVRGLLVRWDGDWVPVHWEGLRAIKITETDAGKRWAVLVVTGNAELTGWHRLYSAIYGAGWTRGFLITSAIEHGEELLAELAEELQRLEKLGMTSAVALDNIHPSALFQALLGRAARNTPPPPKPAPTLPEPARPEATPAAVAAPPAIAATVAPATTVPAIAERVLPAGEQIVATYQNWLNIALFGSTMIIAGLALWHYIRSWITFLYYRNPALQTDTLGRIVRPSVASPVWMLIGAHLALLVVVILIGILYHLFPTISADRNGITLHTLGRATRLSWNHVRAVKATSLNENRHVVLIEADPKTLPWWYRVGPLAYEGGVGRGGLVWPMAHNFDLLMQRIAIELTRRPAIPGAEPRLRDDPTGGLVMLVTHPSEALDELVLQDHTRTGDPLDAPHLRWRRVWGQLPKMLPNAVLPALLLLAYRISITGNLNLRLLFVLVVISLWGLGEWLIVSLVAKSLDEIVSGRNRGWSGLYLYPTAQVPRLLPLAIALVLTLVGYPIPGALVWACGIAWSSILTAGLWEALYGWRGTALIAGTFMSTTFQLLTLIAVTVFR